MAISHALAPAPVLLLSFSRQGFKDELDSPLAPIPNPPAHFFLHIFICTWREYMTSFALSIYCVCILACSSTLVSFSVELVRPLQQCLSYLIYLVSGIA